MAFVGRRPGDGRFIVLALCLVASGIACKKRVPEAPVVAASAAPADVEVLKGGRWLFTYVEPDGRFSTTDKPEVVPEAVRGVVRAVDPAAGISDGTRVFVVNLGEVITQGKAKANLQPRDVFETRALAQLPRGESSARDGRPTAAEGSLTEGPLGDGGASVATTAAATDGGVAGEPSVVLYGTSWCGACRSARAFFREKNIPFLDRDIEKDPAAARDLATKAARAGVPADRVPVLDVAGRLLVGFDRARVLALLGRGA